MTHLSKSGKFMERFAVLPRYYSNNVPHQGK